ncbi:MAG: hypothetical protein IJ160_01060 [Muribaculaceae bacterium]|nr:hypothetical protein [Muribaculaceae bacterium]
MAKKFFAIAETQPNLSKLSAMQKKIFVFFRIAEMQPTFAPGNGKHFS